MAVEQKNQVYYYHADGLGSIIALTDKRQKVVQSYTYDSFGGFKKHGDKVKDFYTFAGRIWDADIKLYENRNRFYDPKNGRFTTYDPSLHLRGSPEIPYLRDTFLKTPQKLNPYIYTNNPIRYVDPYGLDVRDCFRPMHGAAWTIQYHRYLWIDGAGWGLTTADGSMGLTTTSGILEPDNATSGLGVHCVPIQVTDCQKKCLKKR